MKMMHKRRHVITSWPISFFWVFLSIAMGILATYSFLQADWVIKRNLVVTNYYQPESSSPSTASSSSPIILNDSVITSIPGNSSSPASSRGRSDSPYLNRRKNQTFIYPSVSVGGSSSSSSGSSSSSSNKYLALTQDRNSPEATNEDYPRPGLHVRRVIKVTKVVTTIRFGTIGVCSSSDSSVVHCRLYSRDDPYAVSAIWSMVTIIGGSGCMTLCVSAVLSLLAIALPSSQLRHQVATTIGHAQTVAVVLLFLSLLLFPLGFDSDFVRYHCGVFSGPYSIADCEIGWAYALVLVCASLALYCPVLVKFTADIRYDALPKYL